MEAPFPSAGPADAATAVSVPRHSGGSSDGGAVGDGEGGGVNLAQFA